MPRHATTSLGKAPVRNYGSEGGPWCNGCQCWTECDGEAAAGNVCVRCGRPGVVMKAPAWCNRVRASVGGRTLDAEEVHAAFERMRAVVEEAETTDGHG